MKLHLAHRVRAAAAFAALLVGGSGLISLAACDRVEVSTQNQTKSQGNGSDVGASTLAGGAAPATLLQRIAAARDSHAFQGVRTVETRFQESGQSRTIAMRERVSSDGQGRFAVETLEIIEPSMSAGQQAVQLSLQSLRQGMNWRFRDFSIDSLGLFVQNYRCTDLGTTETIAGVLASHFLIERTDASGSRYELAVDVPTGLVLAARETTQEGTLISESRYESFALTPDLSAVAWHQSANAELAVPIVGSLGGTVGFEPAAPRVLPPGYQLIERSKLIDPTDQSTWVRATYSDGLESVFFLHGGPIVGGNGIRSGAPEIQADLVEVAVAAPWVVARGNLRGQRVMALGKLPESELLLLIRSSLP